MSDGLQTFGIDTAREYFKSWEYGDDPTTLCGRNRKITLQLKLQNSFFKPTGRRFETPRTKNASKHEKKLPDDLQTLGIDAAREYSKF